MIYKTTQNGVIIKVLHKDGMILKLSTMALQNITSVGFPKALHIIIFEWWPFFRVGNIKYKIVSY